MSELQDTFAAGEPPRDHVERVRAQWARERPDLDTTPMALVARLGRARSYAERAIDVHLAGYGINRQAWDVLASLRRVGPPYRLTPTALYRGLMRTSGAMTHRLAQLEAAGLITRPVADGDGRSVLVELTEAGRDLVDRVAPEHLDNERQLLSALSADDQRTLTALLAKLLVSLETEHGHPTRRGRPRSANQKG